MVLGAVLHHEGRPCSGGALGGSDKATKLKLDSRKLFDLSKWNHLLATEGQFGAAYKGSLINLGIFDTDADHVKDDVDADAAELDQETQAVEVQELSALGKRLAAAFDRSVRDTVYVKRGSALRNAVRPDILAKFGSRAGLCEIAGKRAYDRGVLRDLFFANGMAKPAQIRRRMSLLLILESVGLARVAATSFDNVAFSDICYFGTLVSEDEPPTKSPINVPAELSDIYERWRVYYTQTYLAEALQSILVTCVRGLRGKPAGMPYEVLLQSLNSPSLKTRFREVVDVKLPKDFFALSVRETLTICGIGGTPPANTLPIDAPFSERSLQRLLVGGEANESAAIVLATMLLYGTIQRYGSRVSDAYSNWYAQHVKNPASDIALPEVVKFLSEEFGSNWIECSNGQVLRRIIWRFVVRQHQAMSYERGFGGASPLFHVDGTTIIGTGKNFTDPQMPNLRLGSALQILSDLGLIRFDDDVGYVRTPDGEVWLATELKREAEAV